MTKSSLTTQVTSYHKWKNRLITEIANYQNWLQKNDLFSDDISHRLQRGFKLLREDELTIAFVGEYSRGKTELINALFFSGFGQRMLPSQAGRTTMCPTELFYDKKRNQSYLRLLPIETRTSDSTLSELRDKDDRWTEIPLDTSSPEAMREALDHVANTKTVTLSEAKLLGFNDDVLDFDPRDPTQVIIPAWRHALISLRDPMLEQGLRILDTPGLNALGSEPELTLSMLPAAHAILFLLSADAGVTASDMTIWNHHIAIDNTEHTAGRFAVLNKIDVLWDDLQGDNHTRQSIDHIIDDTARHLELNPGDVIPVSAKQSLIAKVKGDKTLLERSQLSELEKLLGERILGHKEKLITQTLINDVLGMLATSEAILSARSEQLRKRLADQERKGVDKALMQALIHNTQKDYDQYNKRLISLRSSRRLMQSQGDILLQLVNRQRFEDHVELTRDQLSKNWTTRGMNRSMSALFSKIEDDIANLMAEAILADKLVTSIYAKYKADIRAQHLHPTTFSIKRPYRDLKALQQKAEKFQRSPKTIMTEQKLVIRRFFNTLVNEARSIHQRIVAETERWPEEALLPIIQYTQEQKTLLERQIRRLKNLSQNNRTANEEKRHLQDMLNDIGEQLQEAKRIQKLFRRPAPTLATQKVVSISRKIV